MVTSVTPVLKRLNAELVIQLQAQAVIAACEEAGYSS
jgi:hypothetical protein